MAELILQYPLAGPPVSSFISRSCLRRPILHFGPSNKFPVPNEGVGTQCSSCERLLIRFFKHTCVTVDLCDSGHSFCKFSIKTSVCTHSNRSLKKSLHFKKMPPQLAVAHTEYQWWTRDRTCDSSSFALTRRLSSLYLSYSQAACEAHASSP